jgi:hypothetical protein
LGLLILCKLLYEYLPAITRKPYETPEGRIFTKKWWIRLLILGFAIPGYFMTFLSQHLYLLLFILVVAVFVSGFPLAYAWNKENKGVPPNQQSFWKVTTNKTLSKEWEKYKKAPNKLSTFSWYYTPGIYLSAMGFGFFGIFWLISSCSQIFTLIFIGWLIKQYFYKIHSGDESLDIKLLKSLSAFEGGWKGIFGFVFIFTGFAIPGMWISYLLCDFILLINAINSQYLSHLLILFSQLPSSMYQILFWYAILERFPHFLQYWKSGLQEEGTPSLPTGQIYAFIGSCIFPFYVIIIPSLLQRVLFLKLFHYYLIFSVLLIINFAYIGLIVHTLLKWREGKTLRDAYKDNIKIPLALSAQFMVIFLAGYIVKKSIFNDLSLPFLLAGVILIILFFTEDWQNFLEHQYEEGLTNEILGILPAFVGLIIANIITFVWAQPIFYLILTLSLIAVPFGIPKGSYKMVCYLLHKFCVPLTNEIVKALDIIKKSCNRLFLALQRKEVINKVINGILLAVVTVNTFVCFLPKYVAIALGVLILGKLLYEYLPAITGKLYGSFAEQRWVRLLIVCFAAPGYFMVSYPWHPWDFIMVLMVFFLFLFGFPLGYAWESANKDVQIPERQFWKVAAKVMNKDLAKEWAEYRTLPNSITKMILKLIWWYGPGVTLSLLGFFCSGIFLLVSIHSLFFTIVLVGWVLSSIPTKNKYGADEPTLEKRLLILGSRSFSVMDTEKGNYTSLLIFTSFCFLGTFYMYQLFNYIFFLLNFQLNNPSYPTAEFYIDLLCLLLISLPLVYLFAFWYAILRRLPSFLHCWENGSSGSRGFSLPKGGICAFIASCFYASNLVQNREELRDLLCLFFTGNNDPGFILSSFLGVSVAHILVISFFSISIVYIHGILQTMKKWWRKELPNDICRDNIRIPFAFLVLLAFLPPFEGKENFFDFTSLLVLGTWLLILFFIPDWKRFLENKYSDSLAKYILTEISLLVFLFLALELIVIFGLSSIVFYLILALSIILIFVPFLDYRKKQLSRAQESRRANSINQNEEKKLKKL